MVSEKGKECDVIFYLIINIASEIDNSNVSLNIFSDLSKDFDSVNHAILLAKLKVHGVEGMTQKWFTS